MENRRLCALLLTKQLCWLGRRLPTCMSSRSVDSKQYQGSAILFHSSLGVQSLRHYLIPTSRVFMANLDQVETQQQIAFYATLMTRHSISGCQPTPGSQSIIQHPYWLYMSTLQLLSGMLCCSEMKTFETLTSLTVFSGSLQMHGMLVPKRSSHQCFVCIRVKQTRVGTLSMLLLSITLMSISVQLVQWHFNYSSTGL